MTVNGESVRIDLEDVEIFSEDIPGWLVANEGILTLALDVTITDELRREGVARELINRIQNLRKDSGFDVTDKIHVTIYASGSDAQEIEDSLKSFSEYIASQTLALSVNFAPASENVDAPAVEWNEGSINIKVERA